jgi:hypothetical protein
MTTDPVKQSWQSSVTDPVVPPIDQLRAGAMQFYRKVRRRNLIEYLACVFVVVIFSAYAVVLPLAPVRAGAALVVIGTLFIAWQLHHRASAIPPERAGSSSILAFQRAQLVRQRDALASIFWWYLLPLIPGVLLMMFGPLIASGPAALQHSKASVWVTMALSVVIFGSVWWLNRRGARQLQKLIDDLDAMAQEPS